MTTYPDRVNLFEVGPRDGLQNEARFIPTDVKIQLIEHLVAAGITNIEASSFVSSKAIPQLKDAADVFQKIHRDPAIQYHALVPNLIGLEQAVKAKVDGIGLFTASSNSFTQKNINCSIDESLKRFEAIIKNLPSNKPFLRAYISCAIACPYEGKVSPNTVAKLANTLLDMGVDEISFGDTIGVASPKTTAQLLETILPLVPVSKIAMHFHDTYGMAIANVACSLSYGISTFDASVAGLGGCPYAPGASGNVATEDVIYLCNELGIKSGIDVHRLAKAGQRISDELNRPNQSKVGRALLATCPP